MDSVEKCFQTQMAKTTSLLRDVDEWSLRTLQELKEGMPMYAHVRY
jgi:hypothetical protein